MTKASSEKMDGAILSSALCLSSKAEVQKQMLQQRSGQAQMEEIHQIWDEYQKENFSSVKPVETTLQLGLAVLAATWTITPLSSITLLENF